MKNLSFYLIILLLFACGSSDDAGNPSDDGSNFEISIVANSFVAIDETITITVNSNEPLKSVQVFRDNVDSGTLFTDNQSTTAKFNYSFDTVGNRSFTIKATNLDNVVREREVLVSVNRGNTIKISSVQVLSFHNIDQTWDPEYSDTDPNRLADLKFAFVKPKINVFNDNFGYTNWFISSIKENQGILLGMYLQKTFISIPT